MPALPAVAAPLVSRPLLVMVAVPAVDESENCSMLLEVMMALPALLPLLKLMDELFVMLPPAVEVSLK